MKNLHRSPLALLIVGVLFGALLSFGWMHRHKEKMKLKHLLGIGAAVAVMHVAAPSAIMRPAVAQTTFFTDTFSGTAGTALTAHTSDSGGTWAKHPASASASDTLTGAGAVTATGNTFYYTSAIPPTAEYDVTADMVTGTTVTGANIVSLMGRLDPTNLYYYRAGYESGSWYLIYANAGGQGPLTNHTAVTLTASSTYHLKLAIRNASKTLFVQGPGDAGYVQILSTTDNSVPSAGRAGLLTYDPGSAAATVKNYVATNQGVIPPTLTTYPVTNTALYFSPDNSYSDGAGSLQGNNVKGGSTFVTWNTPGAYLRTGFSGTSCTVNLSTTALTAASTPAGYYPTLRWSVDGGSLSSIYTLQAADTALPVATGLSAGAHTLFFQFVGLAGGTRTTPDRYATPVQAVTITGVGIDSAAALSAYTPRGQVVLTTADSLGEGVRVNGASGLSTDQDAFTSVGWSLANALGAEWSSRSIGGGGWTVSGSGGTPPYFTPGSDVNSWWNKYTVIMKNITTLLCPKWV